MTLILEDDFELCDNFDIELQKCLNELPGDFEGLWLCGRVIGRVIDYSENLGTIKQTSGAYGYIVHNRVISKILGALAKEDKLADYAIISVLKKVFRSKKNLVLHRAGISTIKNVFVDYKDLR